MKNMLWTRLGPWLSLGALLVGLSRGGAAVAQAQGQIVVDGAAHPGAVFRMAGRDARVLAGDFANPCGVAVDGQGHVFVADEGDPGAIFRLTAQGEKSPVATGQPLPRQLALDARGLLWFSHRPRPSPIDPILGLSRISEEGRVQAVAFRFPVFEMPCGLAFNRFGSLYVADRVKNAIYIVTISPHGEVHVRALPFAFVAPTGLAFSPQGDLFIACAGTGTIARITTDAVASVFARGIEAPSALAFDKDGNLFVASETNGTIRQLSLDGKTSTLFARGLIRPRGLAFGPDGSLFVTNGHATPAQSR